jgi:hypothetical protein
VSSLIQSSFLFTVLHLLLQAYLVLKVLMYLIQYKQYVLDGAVIPFPMVHTLMLEYAHLEVIMIYLQKVWEIGCFLLVKPQIDNIQPPCMVHS